MYMYMYFTHPFENWYLILWFNLNPWNVQNLKFTNYKVYLKLVWYSGIMYRSWLILEDYQAQNNFLYMYNITLQIHTHVYVHVHVHVHVHAYSPTKKSSLYEILFMKGV